MELNKLIEQYSKETHRIHQVSDIHGNYIKGGYNENFVQWLASRPTCTLNDRKFLDEIKEKAEYIDGGIGWEDCIKISNEDFCVPSEIHGEHFSADLSELVEGKE